MKAESIQKEITKTEEKLKKLKQELAEKQNVNGWVKIPGTDYEVTKEVLHKGKSYNEIMQLKKPEEELLTLKMIGIICENPELLRELKMDGSSTKDDFFFKQPFPQNEQKNYVAGFYSSSDYSYLGCYRDPDDSDSALGVRFARKILKKK